MAEQEAVSAAILLRYLRNLAEELSQQKEYLTSLDAAIGDSDHGINMDRGFQAVLSKLPALEDKDLGMILKTTGMTLVSTVGGASGPLYGTAFMRAGAALADRYQATPPEIVKALEAFLEGILARGKASRGEKTMVDSLGPAVDAFKAAVTAGTPLTQALDESLVAAEAGMKATIPMLATKGRASYLGERSIGHQDAGATSVYLLFAVAQRMVRVGS